MQKKTKPVFLKVIILNCICNKTILIFKYLFNPCYSMKSLRQVRRKENVPPFELIMF